MEPNEAFQTEVPAEPVATVMDANYQQSAIHQPYSPMAGIFSTCALTFSFVSVWLFFNIFCVVFVYKIAKATEKIADRVEKLTLSEKKI